MSLRQLSLTDFRNLKSSTLEFSPGLNIIVGGNASGKTSFLESISIVCQGRSFRTTRLDDCIQHDKEGLLLFGVFENYKSGISRTKNETRVKINGENVHRLSNLAERTPVNIINPDSFELVSGSPGLKREYIDRCLFHVEHSYRDTWVQFMHALKQRNALLRSRKNLSQLDYWNDYLCQHSLKIYSYRKKYIRAISDVIGSDLSVLTDDLGVSFQYVAGWKTEVDLRKIYEESQSKDIKYGFTQYGVHRDNIVIKTNNHSVKSELSRGQVKRLSLAMVLAQIILIKRITGKKVILLLDDIHSELDEDSVSLVMETLFKIDIQLFISLIRSGNYPPFQGQECKMFHVEHGIIKAVKNP
jgi:DNA replication and repair protein RecF